MDCAIHSGSRSGPGRASSGSATSAGTPGRRSTASPTRPTRRRELRLAVLRGRRPAAGLGQPQRQHLREPLHGGGPPHHAVLHLSPRRAAGAARLHPAARRSRGSRSTAGGKYPAAYTARCSSPTTAKKCLWAMMPGANGLPDPTNSRTFATGVTRSTSRPARTAASTTSTSPSARSTASTPSGPATSPRSRPSRATPSVRRHTAGGHVRRVRDQPTTVLCRR